MKVKPPAAISLRFRPQAPLEHLSRPDQGGRTSDPKSHSNPFECVTPKFLKNRPSLIYQKLTGGGKQPPDQVALKLKPF
jgi:hypothetical protein